VPGGKKKGGGKGKKGEKKESNNNDVGVSNDIDDLRQTRTSPSQTGPEEETPAANCEVEKKGKKKKKKEISSYIPAVIHRVPLPPFGKKNLANRKKREKRKRSGPLLVYTHLLRTARTESMAGKRNRVKKKANF